MAGRGRSHGTADATDELAGKCSGTTCCLASGNLEDGFALDELEEPDTLAGKCSGTTCCLALGTL